mgnify:CR=1 FL=1
MTVLLLLRRLTVLLVLRRLAVLLLLLLGLTVLLLAVPSSSVTASATDRGRRARRGCVTRLCEAVKAVIDECRTVRRGRTARCAYEADGSRREGEVPKAERTATERRHRAERRILLFHGSRITRSALKNARKGLLMTVPDERHEVIGGMSRSPSSSPPCSQGHGPDRPRRQLHPECSTLALASLAGSRSERMRGQAVRGPTHRSQTSNHGKNREE